MSFVYYQQIKGRPPWAFVVDFLMTHAHWKSQQINLSLSASVSSPVQVSGFNYPFTDLPLYLFTP